MGMTRYMLDCMNPRERRDEQKYEDRNHRTGYRDDRSALLYKGGNTTLSFLLLPITDRAHPVHGTAAAAQEGS
jgi:hypothetical protein